MRVHHIALRCADPEVTAAFYEGVLGLRRIREQPGYSLWLAAGQAVLMLEQRGADEQAAPGNSLEMTAFAVEPDEREALARRAAEAGVAEDGRTEHTLYLRDPDGRRVGLSSYRFD